MVSLTSHRARFGTLPLTLKTLLTQSVRPDLTVLWLGEADRHAVPDEVRALEAAGLSIGFTTDRGPHTKLLPSLETWPAAHIVTADDDIYYGRSWLETLITGYVPGRRETRCHRARRIVLRADGTAAPYRSWNLHPPNWRPSPLVFATGVGGVFYPRGILPSETLDFELISRLCPTADDIWFHFMTKRGGATVRRVIFPRRFPSWEYSRASALARRNVRGGGNDEQMARMQAHFGPIMRLSPGPRGAI